MAAISGINWTDASFAPWLGCTRISPASDRCYAAAIDKHASRDRSVGASHLSDVFDNRAPEAWRAGFLAAGA